MDQTIVSQLAPHGVLRAAVNMSNFLLVTSRAENGDPQGCSPDMAAEVARQLGVPLKLVPFKSPGEIADTAGQDIWDIGLIGAEPQRAAVMTFTNAYVEIESTYLVPAGSPIQSVADVDKPGVRLVTSARSAYGLWLENNIKHATLILAEGLDGSFNKFVDEKLDALAGLRPRLVEDVKKLPGARILDGQFSAVQQAIGTGRKNVEGAAFLHKLVEEAKASGLVQSLLVKHGTVGRLSVAAAE